MIEINNLTAFQINEQFLRKVAKKVLEGENKKQANFSLVFVGQGRIRTLNKKYRKKNRSTDILAFPEPKELLKELNLEPNQKNFNLGEIVICLEEVKKNSKRFNSDFEKELTRVLVHGILHLLGYDHENNKEKTKEMKEKEEHYLNIKIKN